MFLHPSPIMADTVTNPMAAHLPETRFHLRVLNLPEMLRMASIVCWFAAVMTILTTERFASLINKHGSLIPIMALAFNAVFICRVLVGFGLRMRMRDVRLQGRLLTAVVEVCGFFVRLSLLWLYNLFNSAWMVFFTAGCLWSLVNLASPEIAKRWPPFPLILICHYVAYKQWDGIAVESQGHDGNQAAVFVGERGEAFGGENAHDGSKPTDDGGHHEHLREVQDLEVEACFWQAGCPGVCDRVCHDR